MMKFVPRWMGVLLEIEAGTLYRMGWTEQEVISSLLIGLFGSMLLY